MAVGFSHDPARLADIIGAPGRSQLDWLSMSLQGTGGREMALDEKDVEALKSLSLLYVEDDLETREELAMMLAPWVGTLYVAADGQDGLDLFKEKRPDLVVTDIQMPRVNGLAMGAEIRSLVPEQPIIVVTAFSDAQYLFRAIEMGIDQYLPKPISVERLLGKLAEIAGIQVARKERARNLLLLEQYKHMVDQSAIVCKLDTAGRIIYVNDKLCAISGFLAQDLIGRDISMLRQDGQRGEGWGPASQGLNWVGIVRNRTQSGALYTVESSMVPILDETGQVTEIVCLDVDVTSIFDRYEGLLQSLENSNLSLHEQRHFLGEYKRALELGTCVCVVDRALKIISVNRQFETLLGYQARVLIGQPLEMITDHFSKADCLRDAAQGERGEFNCRIVDFANSQGTLLQFSVGCVEIHNLQGQIESIILICQDVSESLRLSRDIVDTQRDLLYMIGDVVESRSHETGQHVRRVAIVAKFLALQAGLGEPMADMIETAAPMHDVGKVGIRDEVLNKQGKLLPHEFEEVKHHARIGHSILCKVDRPLIKLAAVIAHQHHERWDGTGYPFGLGGEEIDIAGRIVAVADVLDALATARVYKPAWEEQRVHDYFVAQRGLQFDPKLVDILISHWSTVQELRNATFSPLNQHSKFGELQ